MNNKWHILSFPEIFKKLNSGENGLSENEARRRLIKHGRNKLPEAKVDGIFIIFLRQFQNPMIYVLFAASLAVFLMKEFIDGAIIIFVLFFNAIVGAFQEGKAQNTLLALKRFSETNATVLRNGKEIIISDTEVVPGDIIILREGEKVPADARIILSSSLRIDEAALTGESKPAHKDNEPLTDEKNTAVEQKNMVFKGTHVVGGSGKAIVAATGIETVIGRISKEIAAIDTEIPLKTDIRDLSRVVMSAVAVICVILFISGIALGNSIRDMFAVVISLSVSIIPEGLPIVITLVLATGVWRMSKRNALVKKLQAVEALGQARIIAVDKTGTITKNELVARKTYINGNFFNITGVGYEPEGEVVREDGIVDMADHAGLILAGEIAAYCASAQLVFSEKNKEWHVAGDPTEAALSIFAKKIGIDEEALEREFPKVAELPFSYRTKYQAVINKLHNREQLAVTGAPEVILILSDKIWRNGKAHPLTSDEKRELESVFIKMSEDGMRVIALAISYEIPKSFSHEKIQNLTFVGFVGMKDALRPEVRGAMAKAVSAGIRVVMITGDHKITAKAIAKEAGIYHEGDNIITGSDITDLPDKKFSLLLADTSVFARVNPEDKLRIIRAYQARGDIIAMTGDGVNDAPSLVAADLGVVMGRIGTEVAKEASDIVLLDDNFGTIVSAIEEGRSIYKTIKKVILYLFSTSVGEVLAITAALFLGYPLPILAAQIIWLNLVTDSFLDVALAMEPKEKGLLESSFERPKKYLIDSLMLKRITLMAIPMMIGTLILFKKYFEIDLTKAQTISLTTLAVFQWFNAWNCRSESKSIFQSNILSNKYLIGATIIVVLLQMLAVYNPLMQSVLQTRSLAFSEWLLIIPVASSIIFIEEIRKFFYRRKKER